MRRRPSLPFRLALSTTPDADMFPPSWVLRRNMRRRTVAGPRPFSGSARPTRRTGPTAPALRVLRGRARSGGHALSGSQWLQHGDPELVHARQASGFLYCGVPARATGCWMSWDESRDAVVEHQRRASTLVPISPNFARSPRGRAISYHVSSPPPKLNKPKHAYDLPHSSPSCINALELDYKFTCKFTCKFKLTAAFQIPESARRHKSCS